ncbi:MAG: hypothetical protein N2508_03855 [Anaerolineae bacterium]|nr:hypothetical protein [Anaerolineae bacterium]
MGTASDAGLIIERIRPEPGGRMVLVDLVTLCALLAGWIEQNEAYADSFQQWAARIAEIGREESARHIEAAVAHIAACNRALGAALRSLEERG